MANNLVDYLAQLRSADPKRANWVLDCPNVGTNDFGFIKVKLCKEVIAGSKVTYDFKSAYSTNPTISPVLSRAKATVTAIWIPISLYVPALRDGVQVKAGKDDYSFPTINFNYQNVRDLYRETSSDSLVASSGKGLPYIPANSIFTELGMWRPYFQPIGFCMSGDVAVFPEAKNAIPLLGYYDFYRNFYMNTQTEYTPFRRRGYSVRRFVNPAIGNVEYHSQAAYDINISRADFDELFGTVRRVGSNYSQGDGNFDITSFLGRLIGGGYDDNYFFPPKPVTTIGDSPDEVNVAYNDNHYGELRATYLPDYYTAYLSTENVEYERNIARVQADDDGYITMEQIYHAQRVQNFIRRTVFRNSDYSEFIDAEYGVTPPTTLTKPLFLGSVSTWLDFNDVTSMAQTSDSDEIENNTNLGSRCSLGFGRMVTGKLIDKDKRPFVSFLAKEPGYFMVLEHIVPEVSYFTGFNPMYDKRSLGSLYYPAFEKDGYQDKQFKYLNEQIIEDFNSIPAMHPFEDYNLSYAQELAWWEYMTEYGRMTGQMVEPGVYRHWVFYRDVKPRRNMTTGGVRWAENVLTTMCDTYVQPEDFNGIFANINGLDNFQTYYKHEFNVYQPISHRFQSF
ncbi:MAG: hypothetical protein IKW36_05360 [Alistipes sp.]|nr:hypothetical protein [Alistipes sp.]